MDTSQALERLKQSEITTSKQMLLRWVRQGKIEAILLSKKQGYQIDKQSLEAFIVKKRYLEDEDPARYQLAYKKGYQAGVIDGRKEATAQAIEKREAMIAYERREYQKELILKKCYEETIEINYYDSKLPVQAKRFLDAFGSKTVHFGVLGEFAVFEGVDLIDLADLPYPNRTARKRLENWLSAKNIGNN